MDAASDTGADVGVDAYHVVSCFVGWGHRAYHGGAMMFPDPILDLTSCP